MNSSISVSEPTASDMQTVLKIVLNGLPSPHSKRVYHRAIRDFLNYWEKQDCPTPDKLFLQTYMFHMQEIGVGETSINLRIAAIRTYAREAADLDIWPVSVPAAFARVKTIPARGTRTGIWLTLEQAQALMDAPDRSTIKGLRDRAVLAILLGCGLRRSEVVSLTADHIQKRDQFWVLANIVGKRNKMRTVVIPIWTKQALDAYMTKIDLSTGYLFPPLRKNGNRGEGRVNPRAVQRVVKEYATQCGFPEIAPHDLRRTYAKLAYQNGARLDQIQVNLGHQSLTTTQVYLGIELDLAEGPGSYLDIRVR